MKKVLFLSVVLAFASCKKETSENIDSKTETYSEGESAKAKSPEALGKELFEGTGNCFACHQPDQKVIGPSIKEIANYVGSIERFWKLPSRNCWRSKSYTRVLSTNVK